MTLGLRSLLKATLVLHMTLAFFHVARSVSGWLLDAELEMLRFRAFRVPYP